MPRELYTEIQEIQLINAWKEYKLTKFNSIKTSRKRKFDIISNILHTKYYLEKTSQQVQNKISKLNMSYNKVIVYPTFKYILIM